MRFSVLKAGRATRAARERIGDTDAMFVSLLSRPDDRWDVHDVEHGEFPERLAEYDGLVITGGRASAYDEEPWMLRLLDTVREAHRSGVMLLGICLGHQVVAKALGGEVGVNPQGWDLGLTALELTPESGAYGGLADAPRPLRILETHQDVVTRLPPGALRLASSARTEYEIYHLGPRVLCLQGHPEMDNEEVREIISRRRGQLPPQVVEAGLASLAELPHREFLQEFLQKFLQGSLKGEGLRREAQEQPAV